jgi:DNA-binding NarL/FixJ family response regulator
MRAQSTSPAPADNVGIILVEPLSMVRAGLDLLLSSAPGLTVLVETGDAAEGLEAIKRLRSHGKIVVLAGLELTGERDAFWLVRAIREEFPSIMVLVIGTDLDRVAISRALFVGADGFIHKDSAPDRFVAAILRAAQNEIVLEGLPRGALGKIVEGFDRRSNGASLLTAREVQVLGVAAEGLTAREIARRLGVAERTVTTHLNNIYRKLGATGRMTAVTLAVRAGLISPPMGLPNVVTIPSVVAVP